ncbi:MAG: hypothetical protein COA43_01690 [Robiginitomaculum sp.]|nr:MAG: hypothetical protein COA43_01690 [Robiginitomaculum sp.]
MKFFLPLTVLLIAWAFFVTDTAVAQGTNSHHTMASGPDVYRIEVRNLKRFEVMEVGDSDGVGELHNIRIRLSAFTNGPMQFHSKTVRATPGFLYNDTTNDGGNTSYLNVRKGNRVRLHGRANHDNLWVHAGAVSADGSRIQVRLSIYARELDCVGRRVCRRGGYGMFSVDFNIPNFDTPPSTRCGPENTFELGRLDDKIAIFGADNVENNSYENGNRRHLFGDVFTRHKAGGVILRPLYADICIASSSRASAQPTPPPPSRERFWFLKNVASDRCVTMPRGAMSSTSVPAQVNTCHFRSSIGSTHREKWQLVGTAPSTYFIRSSQGNQCLNLKAIDNREGGPVKIVNCSGHNDQKWKRTEMPNGQFQLRHTISGKCLNVHGREHKNYGQISVYTCAVTPDQRWTFINEHTANDIAALERRR